MVRFCTGSWYEYEMRFSMCIYAKQQYDVIRVAVKLASVVCIKQNMIVSVKCLVRITVMSNTSIFLITVTVVATKHINLKPQLIVLLYKC